MRILGIETSCDETAAAVVKDGTVVHSNVIASSREMFERSGGVIPELAARRQVECIQPVIDAALKEAHCAIDDVDAVAVTRAPGLLGSLLVGNIAARTMAWLHTKPLIGVHHTLGHLSSTWLGLEPGDDPAFPILTLSASGGHSDLWLRTSHLTGTLLGRTRDDAAGEAFDKGASLLGLPYPGGPSIAHAATGGDPHAFPFPLPLAGDDSLDWSFSGLKTALKYLLQDLDFTPDGTRPRRAPTQPRSGVRASRGDVRLADLAASYEHAIDLHLVDRLKRALERHPEVREIHLVGGVSANERLRTMAEALGARVRWPLRGAYCTDNGAMIAAAGEFLARERPQVLGEAFTTSATQALSLA